MLSGGMAKSITSFRRKFKDLGRWNSCNIDLITIQFLGKPACKILLCLLILFYDIYILPFFQHESKECIDKVPKQFSVQTPIRPKPAYVQQDCCILCLQTIP